VAGELGEGATYQFPTEQGLNGAVLCDPSPEAGTAVADAFALLGSFDEDLMAALGAISGEAFSGGLTPPPSGRGPLRSPPSSYAASRSGTVGSSPATTSI
ncbi:MAG: hypothetical protein WKF60_05505, partial [Ilumatobacter sp.]